MTQRDNKIDILRVLGTFLIILAHSLPPYIVTNLRTFDVVLLVFLSGISFQLSIFKIDFLTYLLKRIKKLVIPTYILLVVVFFLSTIISYVLKIPSPFTIEIILGSFLFYNKGIGFIWIVKVYLYIGILLYSIQKISKRWYTLLLLSVHLLLVFLNCYINTNNNIYNSYLLEVIPYGLIAIIGYQLANNKDSYTFLLTIVVCVFLFVQFQIGLKFNPNDYKYPPTFYYLSYGLFVSLILYKIVPNFKSNLVYWLSKNSYNIYLIHIFFIFLLSFLETKILVMKIWYIKFFLLILFSILTLFYLLKIKNKIRRKNETIKTN